MCLKKFPCNRGASTYLPLLLLIISVEKWIGVRLLLRWWRLCLGSCLLVGWLRMVWGEKGKLLLYFLRPLKIEHVFLSRRKFNFFLLLHMLCRERWRLMLVWGFSQFIVKRVVAFQARVIEMLDACRQTLGPWIWIESCWLNFVHGRRIDVLCGSLILILAEYFDAVLQFFSVD